MQDIAQVGLLSSYALDLRLFKQSLNHLTAVCSKQQLHIQHIILARCCVTDTLAPVQCISVTSESAWASFWLTQLQGQSVRSR